MRIEILIIVLLTYTSCQAQRNNCSSITVGEFFQALERIDTKKRESLNYKKYQSFSYKAFKPIEGKIQSQDSFFEVGYNSQNEVREVIHHQNVGKRMSHKMIVYEFENYRILLYQTKTGEGSYTFNPTAFLMMKNPNQGVFKNFMINVVPLFGKSVDVYKPGFSYLDHYPIGKFEDISVVMMLDEDLYPTHLLKLINSKIVFASDINYVPGTHVVDYELASIYFDSVVHNNLKILPETCLDVVYPQGELGDMVLPLHPAVGDITRNLPLWVFNGAHDYK